MSRLFAVSAVFAAVVVSGVGAGLYTGRWGSTQALRDAAGRLNRVPLSLAEAWDGHPGELSEREVSIAELEGHLSRRYVHRQTGETVVIALVCGMPGPVSIHTPDVCYGASGYTVGQKTAFALKELAGTPTFFTADMKRPNTAEGLPQRLFWAWRASGKWQVADNPRQTFSNRPCLYKFYLARELSPRCR